MNAKVTLSLYAEESSCLQDLQEPGIHQSRPWHSLIKTLACICAMPPYLKAAGNTPVK